MMASSDRLKPGEKGLIKVKVDTREKSGPVYRTAQVQSNAPDNPMVIISVMMTVEAPAGPPAVKAWTR